MSSEPVTVGDVVYDHKARVQDALRVLSAELARTASSLDAFLAAQRAAARTQEELAGLSVALADAEVGDRACGQEQGRA